MFESRYGKGLRAMRVGKGFARALAAGAFLLSALVWVGCQQSDIADTHDGGKGGLASGVKSMGQPAKVPASGDHWLGVNATCKDKGPADFGIAFKCTDESDPVCGCDGKTYANYCQAWGISGMNVDHKGACAGDTVVPVKDPPVLPEPITDTANPPWVCGTPDPGDHPVLVPEDTTEPPHTGAPTCADPVPAGTPRCTNESHPVCGCDGKTYINSCLAWTARVNVEHEGACGAGPIHYIK